MLLEFSREDALAAALIAYLAAAYVAYIASGALPSNKAPARRGESRVLADRAAFVAAFALLPIGAFAAADLELPGLSVVALGDIASWALPTAPLCASCWAIGRYSKKGAADLASYPQYLPARWGAAELSLEVLSWAAYLFAYEFAFRGMILYALLPLGTLGAIAVETALYSFAHLPKSSKEAAGAILFGSVASWLTLSYGTALPALALHLAMALGNDRGCYLVARRASATR